MLNPIYWSSASAAGGVDLFDILGPVGTTSLASASKTLTNLKVPLFMVVDDRLSTCVVVGI